MTNTELDTKIRLDNPLYVMLAEIKAAWLEGDLSQTDGAWVDQFFGQVAYVNRVDDEGQDYLFVGFALPDGVLAHQTYDVYDELVGFGIYA
jgi:hypothetical protein